MGKLVIKGGKLFEYAYTDKTKDEKIVIPDGVVTLDNYAFNNCDFIKSLKASIEELLVGSDSKYKKLPLNHFQVIRNNSCFKSTKTQKNSILDS